LTERDKKDETDEKTIHADSGATGGDSGEKVRLDYDSTWKDIIEKYFYPLLKRAIPELYADADIGKPPRFLDLQV
jgi:hypothetical protein